MGGSAEKFILLDEDEDEDEDEENSPTTTTTPVSERPTQPPAVLRSRLFRTRRENVPDYVYRTLFQKVLLCLCFNINYK